MSNGFDLERFRTAQASDFAAACAEMRDGRKRSHWIWYVFPQLAALGRSDIARHYGIGSLDEARAYLADPELGRNLSAAAAAALSSGERDPHRLFGSPDNLKVRSSLTLFLAADPSQAILRQALDTFYDGEPDDLTLNLLCVDPASFAR